MKYLHTLKVLSSKTSCRLPVFSFCDFFYYIFADLNLDNNDITFFLPPMLLIHLSCCSKWAKALIFVHITALLNFAAFYSLSLHPRYASLYFCCAVEDQDNELITLEIIHRYVELLDKYFGSVSLLIVIHM